MKQGKHKNPPKVKSITKTALKPTVNKENNKKIKNITTKKNEIISDSKRGRKPGRHNYFTINTQNAIIDYINEKNSTKKNIIYKDKIKYGFDKLVENTINNNKFPYIKECYADIHHEVIFHLLENINRYDETQGRAFSYFGTIAKNYLIAWNEKEYKNSKLYDDINNLDYNRNLSSELSRLERQETAYNMVEYMIDYLENNMFILFKKQKDLLVIDAVVELLKKRLFIENFNKKLIYILLREMTGLKSHQITKILNKLKVLYLKLIKEYYRKGDVDTTKQNKII